MNNKKIELVCTTCMNDPNVGRYSRAVKNVANKEQYNDALKLFRKKHKGHFIYSRKKKEEKRKEEKVAFKAMRNGS